MDDKHHKYAALFRLAGHVFASESEAPGADRRWTQWPWYTDSTDHSVLGCVLCNAEACITCMELGEQAASFADFSKPCKGAPRA